MNAPLVDFAGLAGIHHVYSGKAGKCTCGCAGTHRYSSAYREEAGKARGYALDDGDCNDRQVSKVVRLLTAMLINGNAHDEGGHVWGEADGRLYIAYRD